jgi:hypothetical protein
VARGDIFDQRGKGCGIRDIEPDGFDGAARFFDQGPGLVELFLPPSQFCSR